MRRIQVAGRGWHVPGGSAPSYPVSEWVTVNTYRDHMLGCSRSQRSAHKAYRWWYVSKVCALCIPRSIRGAVQRIVQRAVRRSIDRLVSGSKTCSKNNQRLIEY